MSSTTANELIALGGLLVAAVGIVAGFLQGERARKNVRDDRRFDQEWAVCVGLIDTALRCQAVVRLMIQSEGKERSIPESDEGYLQHLAAAQLVSHAVAAAFRDYANAWNRMVAELDSGRMSDEAALRVATTFRDELNAKADKLIEEARSLLAPRR